VVKFAWLSLPVVMLLVGCSGPHKGDIYSMTERGALYMDEGLFRAAVDRKAAGVSTADAEGLELYTSKRMTYLDSSAEVQVVELTSGGARVVVTAGEDKGTIGWVLDSDLKDRYKR
jgi:hypothetical protein